MDAEILDRSVSLERSAFARLKGGIRSQREGLCMAVSPLITSTVFPIPAASLDFSVLFLYYPCVSALQEAHDVISSAQASLRALLERAIRENRYADVVAIAPLADALVKMASSSAPIAMSPGPPSLREVAPARKAARPAYPRFLREGDKLVKIGWSKKSRTEYEHRAPFAVATALLAAIRSKVRDGELFTATDVIPLHLGEDTLPDYQAYLSLKWFHEEGIVTKHPRDRYALEPGRIGPNGLEEHWLRLMTTKGSKIRGSK